MKAINIGLFQHLKFLGSKTNVMQCAALFRRQGEEGENLHRPGDSVSDTLLRIGNRDQWAGHDLGRMHRVLRQRLPTTDGWFNDLEFLHFDLHEQVAGISYGICLVCYDDPVGVCEQCKIEHNKLVEQCKTENHDLVEDALIRRMSCLSMGSSPLMKSMGSP